MTSSDTNVYCTILISNYMITLYNNVTKLRYTIRPTLWMLLIHWKQRIAIVAVNQFRNNTIEKIKGKKIAKIYSLGQIVLENA